MFLCERRFSPLSFLSGGGGGSSSKRAISSSSYAEFEDTLCTRLRSLLPPPPPLDSPNDPVPLAYLSRAVGVLASTHAEAARLLSGSGKGATEALPAYLDTSAAVLALCNAASACLDGLLRRRLLLVYALQHLAAGGGGGSGERSAAWRLERVRKAVVEWEEGGGGGEDTGVQLGRCMKGLTPSGLYSGKVNKYCSGGGAGRGVAEASGRAVLAVEAVLELVNGILLAFLCPTSAAGSATAGLGMPGVPDDPGWAGVYRELQAAISARSDGGQRLVVQEVEAVKARTKELTGMIGKMDTNSGAAPAAGVSELQSAVDDLSRGLEGLADSLTGLFRSALRARDAAMESPRDGGQTICKSSY